LRPRQTALNNLSEPELSSVLGSPDSPTETVRDDWRGRSGVISVDDVGKSLVRAAPLEGSWRP